jgi:SPP1 family predicted phage head-tail adaptor
MRIGQLRHRLTIQVAGLRTDDTGAPDQAWSDVTTVFGRINPLTGRELTDAQAHDARVTHEITVRSFSGLTPKHRIKFGTRIFDVLAVLDKDERQRAMRVVCVEQP